jgi:hypothetical protein
LLASIAGLVAIDGLLLALEPGAPSSSPSALDFQRRTGGIGLSAAAGVEWSFHAFDPRLERACENELQPIPGSACPDPVHGAGVAHVRAP